MLAPRLALHLAAAPAVSVTWTGADCPQAAFTAALAEHLGAVAPAHPVSAAVAVRRDGARWTLELTLTDAGRTTTRHLDGPSCASVARAAAFVTAVIVDPTLLDRQPSTLVPEPPAPATIDPTPSQPAPQDPANPPQQPANPPQQPAPPLVPADPPQASTPPAPTILPANPTPPAPTILPANPTPPAPTILPANPSPRVRGFLRLAGGLEALGAPRLGGAVEAAAGPFARAWRVELRYLHRFPTAVPLADGRARIGLWSLGARGCGVLRPSVLELPLCAGLEAGQVSGAGDFTGATPARVPWFAVTAAAALQWAPRRWFALSLAAELVVPLIRGAFGLDPAAPVHTVAPVAPRALFGLELRLPNK